MKKWILLSLGALSAVMVGLLVDSFITYHIPESGSRTRAILISVVAIVFFSLCCTVVTLIILPVCRIIKRKKI